MNAVWNVLTILGFSAMFLLVGAVILFAVSVIYHMLAKDTKSQKEAPKEWSSGSISKAA